MAKVAKAPIIKVEMFYLIPSEKEDFEKKLRAVRDEVKQTYKLESEVFVPCFRSDGMSKVIIEDKNEDNLTKAINTYISKVGKPYDTEAGSDLVKKALGVKEE